MYNNKFVVCIKASGKVLRETKDLVHLPYGSEFTVLVKNLNSRRAKFKLHIDGTDVLDGTEIIVNANSEVEMKRFIRNGNMNEGNAYKFIERIQAIEDGPRGIKADDGIIRVEFWYEKAPPQVIDTIYRSRPDYWWDTHYYPYKTYSSAIDEKMKSVKPTSSGIFRSAIGDLQNSTLSTTSGESVSYNATSATASSLPQIGNDVGITVPGSKVEQKFDTVYGFNSETQSHVIILRLVGKTSNDVEITKAVTVKTRQKCVTCGHVNKANAKFCSACGTALEVL